MKIDAGKMLLELGRVEIFGESIARILNAKNLFQADLTSANLLLHPKERGVQMPDFAYSEASGHSDCRCGIGAEAEVNINTQILRYVTQADALTQAFCNACQLSLAGRQGPCWLS